MIIDNTYFKGEIYVPHARPSITDEVEEVSGDILDFIGEYARECLIMCLGNTLFYEFEGKLDNSQTNGLKASAESKWDDLLNGKSYNDPSTGKTVVWRGIRFKNTSASEKPDKSFLAYYVYFFYEKNDYITRSDIGHVQEDGKNSWNVSPREKVVKAYNKFVDLVQGKVRTPSLALNHGLIGIDYMAGDNGQDVNLYKFINDSNLASPNTYADFRPREWRRINQFGL